MTVQPTFSKDEHARRGTELYEHGIRQQVEAEHFGEIVAIDIETGDFEIAPKTLAAARRLRERKPTAQIWAVRVGHRAVHRYGFARGPEAT